MKQKIKVCSFAKRTLISGLLLPAAVCIAYIWGLLSGDIATDTHYDTVCLIIEAAKTYLTCAIVAISSACLAQYLYRARS